MERMERIGQPNEITKWSIRMSDAKETTKDILGTVAGAAAGGAVVVGAVVTAFGIAAIPPSRNAHGWPCGG
jgi:hypothetical protein